MKRLPNIMTTLRLLMAPAFAVAFFCDSIGVVCALFIYILAMFTDVCDGFLARRMHCESKYGALIDPLADKLMTLTVITCLTINEILPLWILIAASTKELMLVTGASYSAAKGIIIKAGLPGKVATVLYTVSLIMLIPWHSASEVIYAGKVLICIAFAVSFIAGLHYARILYQQSAALRIR